MGFQVKIDQFEGPLELLLSLIEERKMDITKMSLAVVADDFLEYIHSSQEVSLAHLADFLSVASKMILIKSRALLPTLELTEEEEAEINDLEAQLAEYKKFKDASIELGKMATRGKFGYSRENSSINSVFFYPPENITADDLRNHFISLIESIPIVEKMEEEIVRDVMTLEEKMNELQNTLRQRLEMSFKEITAQAQDKVEIIVAFLAMLEMVKQRVLDVTQEEMFSDIRLKTAVTIANKAD